jgi:hypothetical protein
VGRAKIYLSRETPSGSRKAFALPIWGAVQAWVRQKSI